MDEPQEQKSKWKKPSHKREHPVQLFLYEVHMLAKLNICGKTFKKISKERINTKIRIVVVWGNQRKDLSGVMGSRDQNGTFLTKCRREKGTHSFSFIFKCNIKNVE